VVHIQKEVSTYQDTLHFVEVKQVAEIFVYPARYPSGHIGVREPLVQMPWIAAYRANGLTLVLAAPYRTFDKWPLSVA
jgi:hypothetical protein